MFVIQRKEHPWSKTWETESDRYPTLEEARVEYGKRLYKTEYRIMEEYTVIRYKAVK